jgi:hypothetical protein
MIRCACGRPAVAEVHLSKPDGNGMVVAVCDPRDIVVGDILLGLRVDSISLVVGEIPSTDREELQQVRPGIRPMDGRGLGEIARSLGF